MGGRLNEEKKRGSEPQSRPAEMLLATFLLGAAHRAFEWSSTPKFAKETLDLSLQT